MDFKSISAWAARVRIRAASHSRIVWSTCVVVAALVALWVVLSAYPGVFSIVRERIVPFSSSVVAFALFVVGSAMTIWSKWIDDNKGKTFLAIVVLGLGALAFGIVTDLRNAAAARSAEATLNQLNFSMQEQERASERNTALQQETLTLSAENQRLSKELLERASGDRARPAYVWLYEFSFSPLSAQPYLVNPSRQFSAREVTISTMAGEYLLTSRAHYLPPSQGELLARVPLEMPRPGDLDTRRFNLPQLAQIESRAIWTGMISSAAGSFWLRVPAHDGHDSEPMADTVPTTWRTVFRWHGGHFCGRIGTLSAMIS